MRATKPRFREDNRRRVDRMNTWIALAVDTRLEHVQFVFYWIAYEAAYKNENQELDGWDERRQFHKRLAIHDGRNLRGLLDAQRRDVVRILELRQAHPSFWTRQKRDENVRSPEEWESAFERRVKLDKKDLENSKMPDTLNNLFRNLNIVRNQIVHGGSAGLRSRGRTQVMLGAGLLKAFVPFFRDSIHSNIDEDWGKPPYPRVGSREDEECPPPWLVTRENSG